MTEVMAYGNYIIVRAINNDLEVDGIYLPGKEGQQVIRGEVVVIGPGKVLDGPGPDGQPIRAPMQTKVGDTVLINSLRAAPEHIGLDDVLGEGVYMLIPESDIAAIVRS